MLYLYYYILINIYVKKYEFMYWLVGVYEIHYVFKIPVKHVKITYTYIHDNIVTYKL